MHYMTMSSKFVLASALLALLCVYVAHCEEPSCTKFTFLEQLLEKIVRMEMKMEAYQSQLDTSKNTPEEPGQRPPIAPVAFFAFISESSAYNDSDVIVFDAVVTNIGNAYEPSTGVFRAPVDGTYFFQATVRTNHNEEIWAYLTVNGYIMSKLNARGSGGRHGTGTQALLVTMHRNDEVNLMNVHSGKTYYGGRHSTLTGYKLQ